MENKSIIIDISRGGAIRLSCTKTQQFQDFRKYKLKLEPSDMFRLGSYNKNNEENVDTQDMI